jgi:hypothetical protein
MVLREGVKARRDSNQSGVLTWPGANSVAGAGQEGVAGAALQNAGIRAATASAR